MFERINTYLVYLFLSFSDAKQLYTAVETHEMAAVKPGYKGTWHSHVPGLKNTQYSYLIMIDNSNNIYKGRKCVIKAIHYVKNTLKY